MPTQKKSEDRRVKRTRQLLQQAFVDVVREKGMTMSGIREIERCFTTTSIQEITERANVNRGTFYLHFADKYMLADAVVRETFHQQLASALPTVPRWDSTTLHLLTRTVLRLLEGKYQHQHHPSLVLAPMVEQAIHEELTELLLSWLDEAGYEKKSAQTETIARVVSWSIFGTAIQWSQEETSTSADEMADIISRVITEGVVRLAPGALP